MTEFLVRREHLPATREAVQRLVLLHGWGSNREIWRPLLPQLRPWADITLLELPGVTTAGRDEELELSAVLAEIAALAPPEAVYLGWSLGGQLAVEVARTRPERVLALLLLAYNPCFVATDRWPGMARSEFDGFRRGLAVDPSLQLRRFDTLQSDGSGHARSLLRSLRRQRSSLQPAALASSLVWLERDQRRDLADLARPRLHLLATGDRLVPPPVATALETLGQEAAAAGASETVKLAGSHLLPLEQPERVAQEVGRFLRQRSLLRRPATAATQPLDKRDVAASFSRAARDYDRVAALQRKVGERLLTTLEPMGLTPATILDLGSGTGHFYPALKRLFPRARYIGLDLAQGMVEFARERFPEVPDWVVGDAESLPLAAGSVDLVFSSLAFQWCYRPEQLFAELARVLRPGGVCLFSSLGPGTLAELRQAWATVDRYRHVNRFLPGSRLLRAAGEEADSGLSLTLSREALCLYYPRVQDLLRELKTLGAHNVNRDRPAGLTGRHSLRGMFEAYETRRRQGLLPATYEVLFGTLERA